MTKQTKRKFFSMVTAVAMMFSLGTVNALEVYNVNESESNLVTLDYNRIEELPDGGKIYVYIIDGIENRFPVPPEGFKPLTASDEQLETYGFPPRPTDENSEDYEEWAYIMSNYKSTPIPDIKIEESPLEEATEDNGISVLSNIANMISGKISAYGSAVDNSKFYTQIQTDFVHPSILDSVNCENEYWIGFGQPCFGKAVKAGTKSKGQNEHSAFYELIGENSGNTPKVVPNFSVSPGDNIHIYISFQKANNCLTYYFANNTTGQNVSSVVPANANEYFVGQSVAWAVERKSNLGNFSNITFKNCKAMLNTSSSWTKLDELEGLYDCKMKYNGRDLCTKSSISNGSFSFRWQYNI